MAGIWGSATSCTHGHLNLPVNKTASPLQVLPAKFTRIHSEGSVCFLNVLLCHIALWLKLSCFFHKNNGADLNSDKLLLKATDSGSSALLTIAGSVLDP